ncbi:MAG: radical SAM protein [Vicinamibacterales bacterium]
MANICLPLIDVEDRPTRPTTREVAARVKQHGAGSLVGLGHAELLADDAAYQEVECRSALNAVKGMPFRWTLNPYRGCTHGCHYCFARRYHTQFELNAGDDFASVILVKRNFVQVLRRELDRPRWRRELVAVGTATDPYQPIEGRYRLTRATIEALAQAHTPMGLVTKGPMVVRDLDVLQALSRAASCTVYVSVPTVDERAWTALEPGTAPPMQRLRAVRTLADAGLDVGVLMAPIVPGFSSSLSILERTVKAIADHGARFVGCNVMYLQDGTRTHFMEFMAREFPVMQPRLERLYSGGKHPPEAYRRALAAMVRLLQDRYGLGKRSDRGRGPDARAGQVEARPEQVGFRW